MLFNIYYISLVITFLVGLYSYKNLEENFKLFIPYLAFVVVYEFANMWGWLIWNKTNAPCNNIEEIFEFCVFTYFMGSLSKTAVYKKKVYTAAAFIILFCFTNMLFIQGFWSRNTISSVLQGLFMATLVCIYYYNLFDKADDDIVLLKHAPFLAATGLLFYFISRTFFYSCFSYMLYKKNYHFYILADAIPGIANLLLNILLIAAFLYSLKPKRLAL